MDLVYNIHGWLTQINHPDKLQDPGHDTNDVFGMILDYYESSLPGLLSSRIPGMEPNIFHKLPVLHNDTVDSIEEANRVYGSTLNR
jgi:hypothetical protein